MRRPATACRPACWRARAARWQRDYAYHSARHRAHLEAPDDDRPRAGERAVARVNPGRLASGPMPVVFDPRVGSSLLGHLDRRDRGPGDHAQDQLPARRAGHASVRRRASRSPTIRTARTACARARSTARGCRCRRPTIIERRRARDLAARFGARRGNWGWSRPAMPRAASAARRASATSNLYHGGGHVPPDDADRRHRARRATSPS